MSTHELKQPRLDSRVLDIPVIKDLLTDLDINGYLIRSRRVAARRFFLDRIWQTFCL